MRDLTNNLAIVQAIAPAVYADDTTPIVIDTAGYGSALLGIHIGVGGITFTNTNKIEFKLTHSDDGTTYIDVTDDDVQGATGVTNGIVKALKTAHATADMTKIGYVGDKRYLKLLADFGGTHGTGTPISAVAILGRSRSAPVA